MTPGELLRKLAAIGLTTDQIGSVMDIFDAEAEQRKSKARARVQKWRDKNKDVTLRNVTETQHSVTKRLTRAEDSSSRLDISGEDKKVDAAPSARPKATRIPDDFVPDEAWAVGQGLTPAQARVEAAQFLDYWRGRAGKDGTKQDWPATWRVWVRNAIKRLPTVRSGAPPPRRLTQSESLRNMAREAGVIDDTGNPVRRLEASDRDREDTGTGHVIRLAVSGNHGW